MAATCATASNDSEIGQAVPRTVKQHWYSFFQFVSDHWWEPHTRLYTVHVHIMCTVHTLITRMQYGVSGLRPLATGRQRSIACA